MLAYSVCTEKLELNAEKITTAFPATLIATDSGPANCTPAGEIVFGAVHVPFVLDLCEARMRLLLKVGLPADHANTTAPLLLAAKIGWLGDWSVPETVTGALQALLTMLPFTVLTDPAVVLRSCSPSVILPPASAASPTTLMVVAVYAVTGVVQDAPAPDCVIDTKVP